jgi:fructokinase
MVLAIGEILVDMQAEDYPHRMEIKAHPGGAPFNVVADIALKGGSAGFIGAVGKDEPGQFLIDQVHSIPFLFSKIYVLDDYSTSLAFVRIDEKKERHFSFLRENGADFHFEKTLFDFSYLDKASIVDIGSLMLGKGQGTDFAVKLCKETHYRQKLVAFDVNYRQDTMGNYQKARSLLALIVREADILKVSEDEVQIFAPDIPTFIQAFGEGKLVLITLGNRGSRYFYRGKTGLIPTIPTDPVDTTGAGDAFFGRVLMEIDKAGSLMGAEDVGWEKILTLANEDGAECIKHFGAIRFPGKTD